MSKITNWLAEIIAAPITVPIKAMDIIAEALDGEQE